MTEDLQKATAWRSVYRSTEKSGKQRIRRRWEMAERIGSYKDLRVYQNAMDAAMKIFELTKAFPSEEKYSMVDQARRS